MRVNPNPSQQHPTLQVGRVNQAIAARTGKTPLVSGLANGRRDGMSLSPMGKASSVLEGLMNQRRRVNEAKNTLIGDTLEAGGTLDSIKAQLETYEEQLKNLDEQIAQSLKNEVIQEEKKPEKKADEEPKTRLELQNQRIADLTDLSTKIDRSQTVSAIKADLEGEARVLRSELSMSSSSEGPRAGKEERLSEIKGRVNDLGSQAAGELGDVTRGLEGLKETPKPVKEVDPATGEELDPMAAPNVAPEENR